MGICDTEGYKLLCGNLAVMVRMVLYCDAMPKEVVRKQYFAYRWIAHGRCADVKSVFILLHRSRSECK